METAWKHLPWSPLFMEKLCCLRKGKLKILHSFLGSRTIVPNVSRIGFTLCMSTFAASFQRSKAHHKCCVHFVLIFLGVVFINKGKHSSEMHMCMQKEKETEAARVPSDFLA